MHNALVARAVPEAAAMQHAAVVPHHEVAHLPPVPVHAIGAHGMLEQLHDENATLVEAEPLDVPSVRADVEPLAAVTRIGAHQGVPDRWIVAADLGADAGI